MFNYTYHASIQSGLKMIYPKESTHGKYVYATDYIGIAAAYLGRWNDFDFAQGIKDEKLYLVERYKGALEKIYRGEQGSIYKISRNGFLEGKTPFTGEIVNPNEVDVIEEIKITDSYEYLKNLFDKNELDFYEFPNRPKSIPIDDSDIVAKAVKLIKSKPNGTAYKKFIELHPSLKNRLDEML